MPTTPPNGVVNGPFPGAPGQLSIKINTLHGAGEDDEKRAVSVKMNGKAIETTHAQKGDPATFDEEVTVKTVEGPCNLDFVVLSAFFPSQSVIT